MGHHFTSTWYFGFLTESFYLQDVNRGLKTRNLSTHSRSTFQEEKNLEGNVGRGPTGNSVGSSDASASKNTHDKETSSSGIVNKRNSKLNIPAAFLAGEGNSAMNRPPITPKRAPAEENRPGVTPKPAFNKPRPNPVDKESSRATILRTIENAQQNRAHENGDVSNSESETVKKPINPFLARDLEKKVESFGNKPSTPVKSFKSDSDKPVPPWKQPKPAESDKPTPPWKLPKPEPDAEKPVPAWKARASQQAENKSESVPPWKARSDNTSSVTEEKPVPLWKQKNLQNKPEPLNKPETPNKPETSDVHPARTPSWKVKTEPVPRDEDKHAPVNKLKSPFLSDESQLSAAIGKLRRTSSGSEPPPVLRPVKKKPSVKRKSLTRAFDQKKFYAVDISSVETEESPPAKPTKLFAGVNIDSIVEKYKARVASSTGKTQLNLMLRKNRNQKPYLHKFLDKESSDWYLFFLGLSIISQIF